MGEFVVANDIPRAWQWVLERRWYLLLVKAGSEFVVRDLMVRRGLDALAPETKVYRRLNRYVKRKVERVFPLMPRYVLVGCDAATPFPWHVVFPPLRDAEVAHDRSLWRQRGLKLVTGVFGREGRPEPVRARQLARLMVQHGQLVAPGSHRHMRTHHEFGRGDSVEIVDGAFRGYVVTVDDIDGAMAKVLMELFGGVHEVAVPLANLERTE